MTLTRFMTRFCFGTCFFLLLSQGAAQNAPSGKSSADMPDGKITFFSTRDGNFELYIMDAAGNNPTNLTKSDKTDYWASYSPTGATVYFYSKRDGNDEIYSMDANGDNLRNISKHEAKDRMPEISPDGKTILFLSDRDSPEGDIYIMNADGTGVRRLTTNSVDEDVARWTPDGKRIIYSMDAGHTGSEESESNFEIFTVNADGTDEKKITDFPGFCTAPMFSPDGKRIAFYGRSKEGNLDIYTMKPDGSGIKNITQDTTEDYSPAWSPDGLWIAWTSGDSKNYDIWIIELKSGKRIRLTSHPKRDETPVWTK